MGNRYATDFLPEPLLLQPIEVWKNGEKDDKKEALIWGSLVGRAGPLLGL